MLICKFPLHVIEVGVVCCREAAPPLNSKFKQEGQYTYNVTLRRVRESLLPWKSNKY